MKFIGSIVAIVLSLALPGCNSSGGGSSSSGITTSGGSPVAGGGDGGGGSGGTGSGGSGSSGPAATPAQQQFQTVVTQYNALPNYTLTAADIQTLSSQGLLQGNDQTTLNSLISSN